MPRFAELPDEFVCAHRHGCPYLEGLPAKWVWDRYQSAAGLECQYEAQLEELNTELAQAQGRIRELENQVQQLEAANQALHRRQFKGRHPRPAELPDPPGAPPKKLGAPVGHPPWQRPMLLGFHFESVADIPDFPWVTRAFAGLSRLRPNGPSFLSPAQRAGKLRPEVQRPVGPL